MNEVGTKTLAIGLRTLADRIPDQGPAVVITARLRAQNAADAVAEALAADPTLAERERRNIDVLAEVMRRFAPLARQVWAAGESERLAAEGASTAHLGRVNPGAAEDLNWASGRCTAIAAEITAAALPDWDSPERWRELSSRRMPLTIELAEVAGNLRRLVAGALDVPCPDPEAVRLAALAEQISPGAP